MLIIGIGVLVLIAGVVALMSLSGDDSDSASGEGIEQSVPDLRRQTPGSFAAGEAIPVTLEEGDVSFLLTAVADDPTALVAITEVKDPDGEVIYAQDIENVSGPLTNNALQDVGEVSLLAPVHPGLDV